MSNTDTKQQLVMIEWFDSAMHGTDQMSRDEASKLGIIEGISAGMLVNEDEAQITIALDWFYAEDQFRQIASYPKKCIRKVTRRFLEESDSWSTEEVRKAHFDNIVVKPKK